MTLEKLDEKSDYSATFLVDKQPNDFKLAFLPEKITNWIEQNGFDFVTICNEDGNIVYVSSSVEKFLNYDTEVLIGSSIFNYLSSSNDTYIDKINTQSSETQKVTVNVRDALGKYVWLDSAISSIYIRETQTKLFISLSKDITDKKEAEEMLIRSEKMSVAGQLAAGVAHEIRNPLTSLKGFVQLLQAGIDGKDEYYSIMVDEIEKIDSITSELLFIAKPMTDDRNYEVISCMLHDVIVLLNTQAKVYNIKLELQIETDHRILCNRTQMKQVFINLIKNAIEEMDKGGVITVRVTANQTHCYIAIIDQGPGISSHIIHKLKEPFFTTKKDGTGLGLMISNKIIENHNGVIDIRENEDKGSTFCICMPLVEEGD